MLQRQQQLAFRWKRTTRQVFLGIVSTQSQQNKFLVTFLHAAATLAYPHLWQRLHITGGQYNYMADFFEPQFLKYSVLEATKQFFV